MAMHLVVNTFVMMAAASCFAQGITSYSSLQLDTFEKVTASVFILCLFVIVPNDVAKGVGLTAAHVFSRFLPNENSHFFDYHVKLTTFNLVFHTSIIVCYLIYAAYAKLPSRLEFVTWRTEEQVWGVLWLTALVCCMCLLLLASTWARGRWANHPACKVLKAHNRRWLDVARAINHEFSRIDKLVIENPGRKVVITDTWVICCTPYRLYIALQADVDMSIVKAWDVPSFRGTEPRQLLQVHVTSINPSVTPFDIVLDSIYFSDLTAKLEGIVRAVQEVTIRLSVNDRFVQQLQQIVDENPVYPADERCMGCMERTPNVKITSNTLDAQTVMCFCRPMWCLECLSKWFINGQSPTQPDHWLEGVAECPTCRVRFTARDISWAASRASNTLD